MRGTLHLVPAEDLPWLLRLTAVRVVEATARRRAELGLDSGDLDRAREHAESALQGGARLRRQELLDVWDRAGLATTGQRGYHLIAHLAQTGVLCFGPHVDSEPA
ncbi:MAG: winged helix DNA-binding domain-containing protein, partial [Actinomycetota bacterium]|nr:winged helix DNA-binding domain-containing protein [Actinomycetota bacterium]